MSNITIKDAVLTPAALDFIALLQEDNGEGLFKFKSVLTDLMIDVIQQNFGDDKNETYIRYLADGIQLLNTLDAK
jgi:hypothetical protein